MFRRRLPTTWFYSNANVTNLENIQRGEFENSESR